MRRATALLCLLACALLPMAVREARAEDKETAEARAAALHERYCKNVKFDDFASFSKRMAAIRALGTLDCPQARAHLLTIVRKAKGIDDRIVAITALGAKLDAPTAAQLGQIIERGRNPLLTQALGQAYSLASDEGALTWLATKALEQKGRHVLEAALDAQAIHADPRAREHLRAIFEREKERSRGAILAFAALRALGTIADERDRTFLLRTPGYADGRLRLAGAETICRLRPVNANIHNAIVKYLADPNPVVCEAVAQGIARARLVEMTDYLADVLEHEHVRTRAVAHDALVEMHKTDVGWDPADWKRWWKIRADVPTDIKQEPSSSVTSYYGVRVHSDRLLFIIDLSGSMAFPWGAKNDKTRIGIAKAQLVKAISNLHEGTLFNIVVFSDAVKPWRKSGEVLASKEAKADALRWIERTFEKPEGGTFMHAALETAFEQNPQVDTIFLLTDGLATDGEPIVPEAILASVNRWNRFRRVVVHTFALTLEELEPDGVQKESLTAIKRFMKRLATLTGGQCRVVTTPPEGDR